MLRFLIRLWIFPVLSHVRLKPTSQAKLKIKKIYGVVYSQNIHRIRENLCTQRSRTKVKPGWLIYRKHCRKNKWFSTGDWSYEINSHIVTNSWATIIAFLLTFWSRLKLLGHHPLMTKQTSWAIAPPGGAIGVSQASVNCSYSELGCKDSTWYIITSYHLMLTPVHLYNSTG